jgi:hypothetical protein
VVADLVGAVVHGELVGRAVHLEVQHGHAEVPEHVALVAGDHEVQALPERRPFAEGHLVEEDAAGGVVAEVPHAADAGAVGVVAPLEAVVHGADVEVGTGVLRDDAELERVDRKGVGPLPGRQHGAVFGEEVGVLLAARRREVAARQARALVVHVDELDVGPGHRPPGAAFVPLFELACRAHSGRCALVAVGRGRSQAGEELLLLHGALLAGLVLEK